MSRVTPPTLPPKAQAVIRRAAAITQNQWYDLWTGLACAAGAGSVKRNVRLENISFQHNTAAETIELRIIADDIDETLTQIAAIATAYYVHISEDPAVTTSFFLFTTSYSQYRAFLKEARAMQIMYRKTSAAGANTFIIKANHGLYI